MLVNVQFLLRRGLFPSAVIPVVGWSLQCWIASPGEVFMVLCPTPVISAAWRASPSLSLCGFILVWEQPLGRSATWQIFSPAHIPACLWEEVKWCFCQSQYNLFNTTFKKGLRSILKVLHSYQIRNVAELPLLVDWKKISGQLFWSINSFRHFSSKMSNIKVSEECLGFRLWCHFGLRKIVMSIFSNLLPFFRLNDRENNRQTIRENNHHRCVPKLVVQLKVVHMRLHLLIYTGLLNPVERLSSSLPVTYVVPSWNSSDQIM